MKWSEREGRRRRSPYQSRRLNGREEEKDEKSCVNCHSKELEMEDRDKRGRKEEEERSRWSTGMERMEED